MLKIYIAAILAAGLLAGNLAAESEGRVDFRRDVMPLIQQNCIGCHGPTKQMNSSGWTGAASLFAVARSR